MVALKSLAVADGVRIAPFVRCLLFSILAFSMIAGVGSAIAEPTTPVVETAPIDETAERSLLDGQAFRDAFEGKTIHVNLDGVYFGSEQYFSGDRTIWSPGGRECVDGVWAYAEPYICFNYGQDGTACWTIFESEGTVYAESLDGLLLEIVAVTDEPLNCEPDLLS